MSIYTRVMHILMGTLSALALTSCGNDSSKSDKAKLSILPSKPIVITADTVDMNDEQIKGPWFSFRASMSNMSTDIVTIVALEIEVTGLSKSGMPTTSTVSFTPAEFNDSIEVSDGAGGTTTVECKFLYFAQLDPSTSADFKLGGAATACGTPTPLFYIGNNPPGPEGSTTFRYTLKMKPLGWFGTYALPTDRYQRTQTFYTQ